MQQCSSCGTWVPHDVQICFCGALMTTNPGPDVRTYRYVFRDGAFRLPGVKVTAEQHLAMLSRQGWQPIASRTTTLRRAMLNAAALGTGMGIGNCGLLLNVHTTEQVMVVVLDKEEPNPEQE